MRNRIKLTESKLHRVICEAVKSIINEIDDAEKKAQMDADWKSMETPHSYFPELGSEGNGKVYRMDSFSTDWRDNPDDNPSRIKAPYNSYVWNKNFSKHYPTPESYWNPRDTRAYIYTKDKERFDRKERSAQRKEDKKFQRALKAADERPLHRKGSLNRAFDE